MILFAWSFGYSIAFIYKIRIFGLTSIIATNKIEINDKILFCQLSSGAVLAYMDNISSAGHLYSSFIGKKGLPSNINHKSNLYFLVINVIIIILISSLNQTILLLNAYTYGPNKAISIGLNIFIWMSLIIPYYNYLGMIEYLRYVNPLILDFNHALNSFNIQGIGPIQRVDWRRLYYIRIRCFDNNEHFDWIHFWAWKYIRGKYHCVDYSKLSV